MRAKSFQVEKLPRAKRFVIRGGAAGGLSTEISFSTGAPEILITEAAEIARALPNVAAAGFSFRVERDAAGLKRIPLLKLAPETKAGERPPLLLLVHGFETSKEKVLRYGVHFAAAGYYTVLMDLPFHGERRPADFEKRFDIKNRPRLGWFNRLRLMQQSLTEVRFLVKRFLGDPAVDGERAGILGISMGGSIALLAAAAEPRLKAAAPFLGIIDLVGSAGRGALKLSEFEAAQVRKLDPLYAIKERPAAALLAQYGADDPITADGLVSRFEGRLKHLYAETPERFRLIRHRGVAHDVNLPMIRNAIDWFDVFLKKG